MVILYFTKEARTYNGLKMFYSINGVGKIGHIHAKNKSRLPFNTMCKTKVKMDKRLKCKS